MYPDRKESVFLKTSADVCRFVAATRRRLPPPAAGGRSETFVPGAAPGPAGRPCDAGQPPAASMKARTRVVSAALRHTGAYRRTGPSVMGTNARSPRWREAAAYDPTGDTTLPAPI